MKILNIWWNHKPELFSLTDIWGQVILCSGGLSNSAPMYEPKRTENGYWNLDSSKYKVNSKYLKAIIKNLEYGLDSEKVQYSKKNQMQSAREKWGQDMVRGFASYLSC